MAAMAVVSEVPEALRARLMPTNEVVGTFETRKRPGGTGALLVTRGDFRIRPGADFAWRTREPFETLFWTSRERYVYSNEDERVERPLADLPQASRFAALAAGDFSSALKAFEVRYGAEPGGRFRLAAKPKARELKGRLETVDAEGDPTNLTVRAIFPDRTEFEVELRTRR